MGGSRSSRVAPCPFRYGECLLYDGDHACRWRLGVVGRLGLDRGNSRGSWLVCGLRGGPSRPLPALSLRLLLPPLADRLPALVPAVITGQIAQREHGVHMFWFPTHPCSFHAALHHELVGTLHTSTPKRIALRLKGRIR